MNIITKENLEDVVSWFRISIFNFYYLMLKTLSKLRRNRNFRDLMYITGSKAKCSDKEMSKDTRAYGNISYGPKM